METLSKRMETTETTQTTSVVTKKGDRNNYVTFFVSDMERL